MTHLFIKALTVIALVGLSGCNFDTFKNADTLKSETRDMLTAKNFSEAGKKAEALISKASSDYEAYFMLAQAKAQTGDYNAALASLEAALKNGLKDDNQVDSATLLEPIRKMTAYTDLMNQFFPSRKFSSANEAPAESKANTSVNITETQDKQVIRAGDVVIEMPVLK